MQKESFKNLNQINASPTQKGNIVIPQGDFKSQTGPIQNLRHNSNSIEKNQIANLKQKQQPTVLRRIDDLMRPINTDQNKR